MAIIRTRSQKGLLEALEGLHKKKKRYWAIWISLHELWKSPSEAAFKGLIDGFEFLSTYGEWSIYFMQEGDAVLLTENISPALCSKTAAEITHVLGCGKDDTTACKQYVLENELERLKEEITQIKPAAPVVIKTPEDAAHLLDPRFFRLSTAQRKKRERLCILVVEDQRFSRQLVMEILGKKYEVITACDGVEALEEYETHAPNLAFLDIDIPILSGQAVLERITRVDPDSYVVMLTASQRKEDVEAALTKGAMGYIVKPFTKQKIDKYISQYHKLRALK